MGRAALAQVQLDRVRRPLARGVPHHDEVDREPPDHPFARQPLADRLGPLLISRA